MSKDNPDLTAEQKNILFEEGTEPPGSSELNNEKREGSYHCANCGIKLFHSDTKYNSGSGWPSFFQSLSDVFETKNRSPFRLCANRVPLQKLWGASWTYI